jgi:biotin transporter BioY
MALLLSYGLLLNTLGYILTTFLVMWGLFYHRDRSGWISSGLASLISVGLTYLVFQVWLRCQFPRGIFPWW